MLFVSFWNQGSLPNGPWSRQYDHTPLYIATLFVEAGAHINPIEYAHLNTPLSWLDSRWLAEGRHH